MPFDSPLSVGLNFVTNFIWRYPPLHPKPCFIVCCWSKNAFYRNNAFRSSIFFFFFPIFYSIHSCQRQKGSRCMLNEHKSSVSTFNHVLWKHVRYVYQLVAPIRITCILKLVKKNSNFAVYAPRNVVPSAGAERTDNSR